jgi:integrase
MRSGSTIRFHLRNLKAGLNWIRRSKKHRFEDFEDLSRALRAPATEVVRHEDVPVPGQMSAFLTAALEYETPGRLVTVSASGHGQRDRRTYYQRVHNQSATPVSRLFVLLALTGCRLSDALNLKWGNVRADYQQVRYTAIKNGANCVVPLVDTGFKAEVAPRLSRLLRQWRKEAYDAWEGSTDAGKRPFDEQFVLPHHEVKSPVFSRYAWRAVRELTNSGDLGPQVLRRAFTSYAATLGIPSAVVAQWQGHSPGVADKYYRLYAKAAVVDPKSMEEALGLASILDTMLEAGDATRCGADSHSSS